MIIRCDRCDTEFSLDDSQMREGGTTVRCSVCSHVFTAHPPDPRDIAHRPWQIRSEEGVLFSAKNLRVVANWIAEARLTPNDEISRTGHRWRRLSEIPEFQRLLGLSNAPEIELLQGAEASADSADSPGPDGKPAPSGGSRPMPPAAPQPSKLAAKLASQEQGASGGQPAEAQPELLAKRATERDGTASPSMAQASEDASESVTTQTRVPITAPLEEPDPSQGPVPEDEAKTLLSVPASGMTKAKPKRSHRPDPPPIQGSINPRHVPTQEEGDAALESLRDDPKTLRSAKFGAPATLPRMSASLKQAAPSRLGGDGDGEQAGKGADASDKEDTTRSGVSVSDMRARFRDVDPMAQEREAQAARRKSVVIATLSAGALLLAGAFVWWQSQDDEHKGPKEAAVVQEQAPPERDQQASQTRAALQAMDPAALRKMEATLHQQMQREDLGQGARNRAKFLLIELLTERALQLSLAATLTPKDAQMLLDAARSDVMRARTLFDADPFKSVDPVRREVVLLRLEFAEGRAVKELKARVPATGAAPTQALLAAAPLWRDAHDPVTPALLEQLRSDIESLEQSQTPSVLLKEALAVAQLRSGQRDAARRWAQARLEHAMSDPVARRIEDVALRDEEAQRGTGGVVDGTQLTESETSAAPGNKELGADASADALLNRGCRLVEKGASTAGIRVLQRALEKEPQDLDIMLCLAQGYARSGDQAKSLLFFERILLRSPRHRSALYGAATQAAAQGLHDKASKHYRTLLEVSPGHGPAEAYLEVHGGA